MPPQNRHYLFALCLVVTLGVMFACAGCDEESTEPEPEDDSLVLPAPRRAS